MANGPTTFQGYSPNFNLFNELACYFSIIAVNKHYCRFALKGGGHVFVARS